MFFEIFNFLKDIFLTGSYSNQVFPEPLSKEEEDECIKKAKNITPGSNNIMYILFLPFYVCCETNSYRNPA